MQSPHPSPHVGLIGVGLLGGALAEALNKNGFTVMGWDRDPARCRGAESAAAVFERCDRILICLPTYEDSRRVLADAPLRTGHMIADVSTGSPPEAEALGAELGSRGMRYADATVSGSSAQALRRELLVMAGGDAEVIEAFRDIFACFASEVVHVGPQAAARR
jgi:3-hydroxyisobutyrate dehydrogenase-like beta-hydroxyacid dehydrogenase